MSSNPPRANPLSHLWGSFQRAVNDPQVRATPGGVQQYVWQSVRNDFLSRGENLPPGSFQAVNQLLGLAGQQRRAVQNLNRAISDYQRTGLDQAITAQHLAADIDSRSLDARLGGDRYRIRFQAPMTIEGELVNVPLTWDPGLELPQTVSGLLAGLDDAAMAAAQDYDYEYQGEAFSPLVTNL